MMNKRLKQGSTFLLAVALTFPLLTLPGAKAANAINTGQKCSIEFDISGNSSELLSASIPVNLYKVASVDESGNYTGIGAFSKLDLSSVSADNLDAAAATWAERAKEAQGKFYGKSHSELLYALFNFRTFNHDSCDHSLAIPFQEKSSQRITKIFKEDMRR